MSRSEQHAVGKVHRDSRQHQANTRRYLSSWEQLRGHGVCPCLSKLLPPVSSRPLSHRVQQSNPSTLHRALPQSVVAFYRAMRERAYLRYLEAEVRNHAVEAVIALPQEQRPLKDDHGHVRHCRERRQDYPVIRQRLQRYVCFLDSPPAGNVGGASIRRLDVLISRRRPSVDSSASSLACSRQLVKHAALWPGFGCEAGRIRTT